MNNMNQAASDLAKIRHSKMTTKEKEKHRKFLTKIAKLPRKKRINSTTQKEG